MAGSVNKAILVGRLGQDPEVKYTAGGDAVVTFSLATDESYKDRDNNKVEQTEWHRVVAWRKLAEICGQYLTKGSLVYIEGKLKTRSWEQDGVKRYTTEIIVDKMQMLGGGNRQEGNGGGAGGGRPPIDEDDIPF